MRSEIATLNTCLELWVHDNDLVAFALNQCINYFEFNTTVSVTKHLMVNTFVMFAKVAAIITDEIKIINNHKLINKNK
jgi:hypothetical protein